MSVCFYDERTEGALLDTSLSYLLVRLVNVKLQHGPTKPSRMILSLNLNLEVFIAGCLSTVDIAKSRIRSTQGSQTSTQEVKRARQEVRQARKHARHVKQASQSDSKSNK